MQRSLGTLIFKGMDYELKLTPSGHLILTGTGAGDVASDAWIMRVARAFAASQAEGLFELASTQPATPPPNTLGYWREFASLYLAELCRTPVLDGQSLDPIPPPGEAELSTLLLSAPPMSGGEYLRVDVLRDLWKDLDDWTRESVVTSGQEVSAWLETRAPAWRQVGRVCFHLAENKRDPDYPFAFLATYAPSLSRGGQVQYRPLGKALQEYAGEGNRKALVKLLAPVSRAAEQVEFVRDMVESGEIYHPVAWTPAEAYRLLKTVPDLEQSGLLVRLPDWWRKRPRPKVAVTMGEERKSWFGADALLDFRVGIALGDEELTEAEYRELMAAGDGLVYVKGQWIEVDQEKLSEALEQWKRVETAAGEGVSFIEGMRMLAGAPPDLGAAPESPDGDRDWTQVRSGEWLNSILAKLRDPEQLEEENSDTGFLATLRPYQEVGQAWLGFLARLGLGACLADDMGLGKTIQVLALLVAMKERQPSSKPSLLVMPASLLANWKAEIKRFAPTLRTVFVHPSETEPATLDAMSDDPTGSLAGVDLALTSYGMLLRREWLRDIDWRLVILDEAQAIKNPSTRQTRAVKRLRADSRIALTGTPIENRLSDLWSLFDFLAPGLLGTRTKFKTFVKSLESREQDRYAPLRNLVGPYILRRMKTDKRIIADLPDKTDVKTFCGLSKRQAAVYRKSVEELAEALTGREGIERRGLVLAYLMRFKQICNHPSQLLGDGDFNPVNSGKFLRLREIANELVSRQEKALIFTQFRELTDPLAAFLENEFKHDILVLHGGTPVKSRRTLVENFQREDGPPFFILSLKAGGTGLNLTAASHVIHFDRWWNPAVENQATDRAFRIGQHRNVLVHKFICRGTIEERIDSVIEEKTSLAGDILPGGAESLLTEMNNDELLDVVTLDIDRALSGVDE